MVRAGFFASQRVELLDGEVVEMPPQLSRHAFAVNQLMYLLVERLGNASIVRIQAPVALDDHSEPEPDVAVCRPVAQRYAHDHPGAADLLLVIEVAETSLAHDLTNKLSAYAAAGVPAYWVVNLVARVVHVYSKPDPAARCYRAEATIAASGTLTLPGGATLAVSDFLPPA